ncbi:hypothetical protein ACQEPB_00450 [Novosphingobium fluoreni]|uniref:hypothetical protein n=1 Tax=Novosphingobium fluoreni TaxID=1391222 RepID=UPI003DA08636
MQHKAYLTRALKAKDRRYAQIFGKLGYNTADLVAAEGNEPDVAKLRELYEELVGKRPFMGWDAETLAAKIAEKSSND